MSTQLRVFVQTTSTADRDRLREEAHRAGWRIVLDPDEADVVLGPAGVGRAGAPRGAAHDRRDRPVESLTARERDVLALLGDGVGNREIARRLAISEHTVKFHLSAIFGKLGASTRTDAVRKALKLGLIDV